MSKVQRSHSKATVEEQPGQKTAEASTVCIPPHKPQQDHQGKDLRVPCYGTVGGSPLSSAGFRVPALTALGKRLSTTEKTPKRST